MALDVIRVRGGASLQGEVVVSGAKNAALPIFAATLLTDEPCILENVPNLSDIEFMAEILSYLGASVERLSSNSWKITASSLSAEAPYDLVRKMRASICLLGPMVARLRQAKISLPGGCIIGQRPVDLHLKGLTKLGCDVRIDRGYIVVDAKQMTGGNVFLGGRYGSTVTGTANMIMSAVLTPGVTRIESAACEPEIVDLCRMLLAMGATIEGIGSHTLTIIGVDRLKGCRHNVIPDRIEAGTYVIAAGITQGNVTLRGVRPHDLGAIIDKLEVIGIPISFNDNQDIVIGTPDKPLRPTDLITHPYPGFPTDLQAQMCALMAVTPGLSIVTERIYPNRFMHVPELQRMGANIALEGNSAIIHGITTLSGAPVMASDLRASAALILGGLAAQGDTWVQRVYHIDRGYEKIDQKLAALGANITRMPVSEMPHDYALSEVE